MFKTKCGNTKCPYGIDGEPKEIYTYATSRTGPLPVKYCSLFCEKEAKYDKRIVDSK